VKQISYKTFSRRTHDANHQLQRPNVCQFELTFRCGLHCRHCYTDCYNTPRFAKRELTFSQVARLLDKIRDSGVLWLCLTGGDPLCRPDFLEIYAYAKARGFLITVFTSGQALGPRVIEYWRQYPPFVVELTVNAARKSLYEAIAQTKNSYAKVMTGIERMQRARIPFKIKTQVTRDNQGEVPRLEKLAARLHVSFTPNYFLNPRLDADQSPCGLRLTPREVIRTAYGTDMPAVSCQRPALTRPATGAGRAENIFPCAVCSGDGFYVDPYGNMVLCYLIRQPRVNLLRCGVEAGLARLQTWALSRKFRSRSACRRCALKAHCSWCPGRAFLETGDPQAAIEYYCKLAAATAVCQRAG